MHSLSRRQLYAIAHRHPYTINSAHSLLNTHTHTHTHNHNFPNISIHTHTRSHRRSRTCTHAHRYKCIVWKIVTLTQLVTHSHFSTHTHTHTHLFRCCCQIQAHTHVQTACIYMLCGLSICLSPIFPVPLLLCISSAKNCEKGTGRGSLRIRGWRRA
jgi:hypothetical protein